MNPLNPYPHGFFPHDDDADSEGNIPPEVRNLLRHFYFSRENGSPNVRRRIGKGIPSGQSNLSEGLEWGKEETETGNTYLRAVDTFILITFAGLEIQRELEEKGLPVGLFVLPDWRSEKGNIGKATIKLLSPSKEQLEKLVENRQSIADAIRMRLGCTHVVGEDYFGNELFQFEIENDSSLSSPSSPSYGTKETTTGNPEMTATLACPEISRSEVEYPSTIAISPAIESRNTPSLASLTLGQFIVNCERAGLSREFIEGLTISDSVARQMRESIYSGLDGMIFNPASPAPAPAFSPASSSSPAPSASASVAAPEQPARKKPGRKPKVKVEAEASAPAEEDIRNRMIMFPSDFQIATRIGKALADKGETVYTENLRRALTFKGKPRNMYGNLQRVVDGTEYAVWWDKLLGATPGEREMNEAQYREAARWLLSRREA